MWLIDTNTSGGALCISFPPKAIVVIIKLDIAIAIGLIVALV
jgi:hypothetical protein